jgi:hypothetical protein
MVVGMREVPVYANPVELPRTSVALVTRPLESYTYVSVPPGMARAVMLPCASVVTPVAAPDRVVAPET